MTFTTINYLDDGLIITKKQSVKYEDIIATHIEPVKNDRARIEIHERNKPPLLMILDRQKAVDIITRIHERIQKNEQ